MRGFQGDLIDCCGHNGDSRRLLCWASLIWLSEYARSSVSYSGLYWKDWQQSWSQCEGHLNLYCLAEDFLPFLQVIWTLAFWTYRDSHWACSSPLTIFSSVPHFLYHRQTHFQRFMPLDWSFWHACCISLLSLLFLYGFLQYYRLTLAIYHCNLLWRDLRFLRSSALWFCSSLASSFPCEEVSLYIPHFPWILLSFLLHFGRSSQPLSW